MEEANDSDLEGFDVLEQPQIGQPMPAQLDGKWRTCVDFVDLNKACFKDSSSMLCIDQLAGATAGRALLCFMDGYSGYNWTPLFESDLEHTSCVTDRGLNCHGRMPFGLKNAGATYRRLGWEAHT